MSYQEKRSIVNLVSTLLIFAFYYLYVSQLFQAGSYSTTETLSFWATVILLYFPVQIAFYIIIHIIYAIINKITDNELDPGFSDELDKLIQLKATRNTYHVFLIGFFLSIGTQLMDMTPDVMFKMLLTSLMVAALMWDFSQIYFYRRGI